MNRIIALAIGMLALACYSTASQAAITSFTVTSATVSKSTGAITLSGTIVCTANDTVFIPDNIIQVLGSKVGVAFGFTSGTCSGGTDPWNAPQFTFIGSIKTGNASVVAQAFDGTDGSFVTPPPFHQPVTPVP